MIFENQILFSYFLKSYFTWKSKINKHWGTTVHNILFNLAKQSSLGILCPVLSVLFLFKVSAHWWHIDGNQTVQSNPKNQTLVFIRNDWHVLFTLPYWNCTLYYFRLGNLTFHVIPAADIRGDKVLSRRDSNPKSPRQVQWTVEKNYTTG